MPRGVQLAKDGATKESNGRVAQQLVEPWKEALQEVGQTSPTPRGEEIGRVSVAVALEEDGAAAVRDVDFAGDGHQGGDDVAGRGREADDEDGFVGEGCCTVCVRVCE